MLAKSHITKILVLLLVCLGTSAQGGDSRVLHADAVQLQNGANYVQLVAPSLGSNVTYTFPSVSLAFPTSDGSTNYVLRTNGAGVTTWVDTLTTLSASDATHSGYLSSTDWGTFNGKQAVISGSAPITFSSNTVGITQAGNAGNGYLSSTDWQLFNAKVGAARTINTTAPLTGGGALSSDLTLAIPAATTAVNGYLTSTDWGTFNGKQQAITVGSIAGSSNASGATLTAGSLALTPADATNGGVVTNGTQSIAGAKTLVNNVTLSGNAIFPITVDSSTTGSNANLPHTTEISRLTNVSLTSIATLDTTTAVSGTQALAINATGARITLVNNYGSPPANSAVILNATGADSTIPDKGSAQFTYSSTANAWYVTAVNRGVQQLADGGTGAITKAAGFDALSPMTTAGDTVYGGTSGTGTRLAAGSTVQLLHGGTTPSWSAVSLTADVSGVLPTGNMAGPAAVATSGFLSSTDWGTFNSKQATISVSAPITLSTATVGITQSAVAANGYLSSTDWGTFNGKASSTLNNLGVTSINADLTPSTDASFGLGSNSKNWLDVLTYQLDLDANAAGNQKLSMVRASGGSNYTLTWPNAQGGASTTISNNGSGTLSWASFLSNPMTTLGDTIYENSTPTPTALAGNITTTKKFLTQTGNGSISAAPAWGTVVASDLPTSSAVTWSGAQTFSGGYTGNVPFIYTFANLTGVTTAVNFTDGTVQQAGAGVTKTVSSPCNSSACTMTMTFASVGWYRVAVELSTKWASPVATDGARMVATLGGTATRMNASAFVGTADNVIQLNNYNNNADPTTLHDSFYVNVGSANQTVTVSATLERALGATGTATGGLLVSAQAI